ncbi:MAG: hypothetical protein WB421_02270 [Terriglobales bacterium]|jgi:hypothetical protein
MAATQVVLYFDRQEDAVLFTLAASSAIAADEPVRTNEAMEKIAREICKASRITTEGALNPNLENGSDPVKGKCA